MTRQAKTPRQRAEEQLGVADRKVKKLQTARLRAAAELQAIESDLEDAVRRRDYLAQSPDLPKQQPTAETTPRSKK
jgi:hypothetical protein